MANPITIIKNDHKIVEDLFTEYESLGNKAFKTKQEIAEQICQTIKQHADMEEKLLYPSLEKKLNKEDGKMVDEAYAEHEVVKSLIEAIESIEVEDPQFDAKLKVLHENISHHVKEEESELLPETEKSFSEEELEKMGDEMEVYKIQNI